MISQYGPTQHAYFHLKSKPLRPPRRRFLSGQKDVGLAECVFQIGQISWLYISNFQLCPIRIVLGILS